MKKRTKTPLPKLEEIEYRPGRHIAYIDGEWVVVDAAGRIIARDLHVSEEDAERLVAAVKKSLGV